MHTEFSYDTCPMIGEHLVISQKRDGQCSPSIVTLTRGQIIRLSRYINDLQDKSSIRSTLKHPITKKDLKEGLK